MQGLFKLIANSIPQRHPTTSTSRQRRRSQRSATRSKSQFSFRWRSNKNDADDDDENHEGYIDGPTITLTGRYDNGNHVDDQHSDHVSMLYILAKTWKFEAIVHRVETHPHEACGKTRVDRNGDTALHWAVFGNPPLDAVEALLSASPDAASAPNKNGDLPLHVACSYRARQDVIRSLIIAYPDAVATPNAKGFWPIHILCDAGCTSSILKMVLDEMERTNNLDVVVKTDGVFGRTPLHILNARKNLSTFVGQTQLLRSARQREQTAKECNNWNDSDDTQLKRQMDAAVSDEFWSKASVLILAEHYHSRMSQGKKNGRDDNDDIDVDIDHITGNTAPVSTTTATIPRYVSQTDGIITGCISIQDCPSSLLEYALLVHRDELTKPRKDDHRNLPLHTVCSQYERPPKEMRWRVMEVLRACPEAASMTNSDGKVPLELFLNGKCRGQNGKLADQRSTSSVEWSETLRQLILAYPVALEMLDLPAGLYPMVMVKVGNGDHVSNKYFRSRGKLPDEDKSRSAIFELLRGCPNLITPPSQPH